jgi:hypothetical protein
MPAANTPASNTSRSWRRNRALAALTMDSRGALLGITAPSPKRLKSPKPTRSPTIPLAELMQTSSGRGFVRDLHGVPRDKDAAFVPCSRKSHNGSDLAPRLLARALLESVGLPSDAVTVPLPPWPRGIGARLQLWCSRRNARSRRHVSGRRTSRPDLHGSVKTQSRRDRKCRACARPRRGSSARSSAAFRAAAPAYRVLPPRRASSISRTARVVSPDAVRSPYCRPPPWLRRPPHRAAGRPRHRASRARYRGARASRAAPRRCSRRRARL